MTRDDTLHFIRRTFIAGLLTLLPLFITYVLVAFLFNIFTGVGAPLVAALFGLFGVDADGVAAPVVAIINLLLSVAAIFLLGLIGTNLIGRRILAKVEALLLRLPAGRQKCLPCMCRPRPIRLQAFSSWCRPKTSSSWISRWRRLQVHRLGRPCRQGFGRAAAAVVTLRVLDIIYEMFALTLASEHYSFNSIPR